MNNDEGLLFFIPLIIFIGSYTCVFLGRGDAGLLFIPHNFRVRTHVTTHTCVRVCVYYLFTLINRCFFIRSVGKKV